MITELKPYRKLIKMGQTVQIDDQVDTFRGFGNYVLRCWTPYGGLNFYRVRLSSQWGDRDICNHLWKCFEWRFHWHGMEGP